MRTSKALLSLLILLLVVSCGKEKKISKPVIKKEANVKELLKLNDNEKLITTISTNKGEIKLQLFADKTPKTVENFVGLALKGYYDGCTFHRVIDGFMIQGGDPTGTGSGGMSIWGKDFEDEIVEDLTFDGAGILAMANRGPNTNGSQFFITLDATDWLNGKHTIFGKVIEGMDVVSKIGSVQTRPPFDKPVEDIIMNSVKVEKIAE